METNINRNEKILAIILIACCIYQLVYNIIFLINYSWGTVFFHFSRVLFSNDEISIVLREKFPFWWLTYLFIFSLIGLVIYFIIKENANSKRINDII